MSVNLNGDLSQWTMGTAFAACASGQMLADSWRLHKAGTSAVLTCRKSTDVPSLAACGRIIHASLEVEVTTADASVASTDVTAITYRGEGSEWAEIADGPVTVFGYVKTNCPGFYNVVLSNGPETYHAAEPIIISAADYWTKFAVNIERAPGTVGTDWYTDSRVGYTVAFTLMTGSFVAGAIGAWESGVKFGSPWQVNFNATVGNKFKVCGLRVCAYGDARESYQPPELTELACMRYLEKSFERGTTPASGAGFGTGETVFPAQTAGANLQQMPLPIRYAVPKRKAASVITYSPITAGSSQARMLSSGNCTATTVDQSTAFAFRATCTAPAGTTVGEPCSLHWVADASLPALGVSVGS